MYSSIYVPVDNSEHSNVSIDLAVGLAKALGARLVGSHVYAAKLHDVRFKQMEFTLPDEYKEEEELEKQRKIHDALIARGLHLISDSYLDQMEQRATEAGIPFERKHFDGKNFEAIVKDVNESAYDLVVLGALGMGAVKDSQVGSVCERTLRRTKVDTLVVRDVEGKDLDKPGAILACLDGSPESWGGVATAVALGKTLGRKVVVVSVAEPGEEDGTLLASHLDAARTLAAREGVPCDVELVTGNARREIARIAGSLKPWLVVAGRVGLDGAEDADVGSTAETLVRTLPCNVLVSSRRFAPAEIAEGAAA